MFAYTISGEVVGVGFVLYRQNYKLPLSILHENECWNDLFDNLIITIHINK